MGLAEHYGLVRTAQAGPIIFACVIFLEHMGLEPMTLWLPAKRATSCANAPLLHYTQQSTPPSTAAVFLF